MPRNENPDDKTAAFLKELAKLTRRTGISIGGCGCDGSPWLAHNNRVAAAALTWDPQTQQYRHD